MFVFWQYSIAESEQT